MGTARRLDKYYSLVRRVVEEAVELVASGGWDADACGRLGALLGGPEGPLGEAAPRGLQLHLADVLLDALQPRLQPATPAPALLALLEAPLCALRLPEPTLLQRLRDRLFARLLEPPLLAHPAISSLLAPLTDRLFALAADPRTPSPNRKPLYALAHLARKATSSSSSSSAPASAAALQDRKRKRLAASAPSDESSVLPREADGSAPGTAGAEARLAARSADSRAAKRGAKKPRTNLQLPANGAAGAKQLQDKHEGDNEDKHEGEKAEEEEEKEKEEEEKQEEKKREMTLLVRTASALSVGRNLTLHRQLRERPRQARRRAMPRRRQRCGGSACSSRRRISGQ
jgi:hypothetical protein